MAQELTQEFVDNYPVSPIRKTITDSACRGLSIDIRHTGKTWHYRFTDHDGKAKSIAIGDACVISLEKARKQAIELSYLKPKRRNRLETQLMPTLKEYVEKYYLPHAFANKRSARDDREVMYNHILPAFGHLPLDKITKSQISFWLQEKKKSGLANGTVNKIHALLKGAYSRAIEWEIGGIEKNPAKLVKALKEAPHIDRFLKPHEAQRLLSEIEKSDSRMLRFIIPFLLFTGARRGEVFRAKWEHIDFERALWTIPKSKSGKPRYVPLSPHAIEVLHAAKIAVNAYKRLQSTEYVFPNLETGHPYTSVWHPWDKCRRRAGLANFRMHDLRHSFASALVNSGMTLYDVKEILGHSNIATTQRYAHLSRERLQDAVNLAGAHYSHGETPDVC